MTNKLVKMAKAGNKEAFNQLIIHYQNDLYRIAKSRLYNEDDVCDAIQETILTAYQSIDKLVKTSSFKAWIIKILINNCNKIYQTNKTSTSLFTENDLSLSYGLESNLEFLNLMNSLSIDERTIFILYYQDGYSTKEISKILDINHNTVRSKMLRAKSKLENILKEVL
ncbi:MAG: RNA polymerase sigma factor [Clostridia bacterium]|nr:RNA polymerase sigma factor [Clostridia bacterium]